MEEVSLRRNGLAHTVAAIPLTILIYVAAGTLMSLIWYVSVGSQSWLPEPVPSTMTSMIGALAGVNAAKAACAAWLPSFNRKVCFGVLALFLLAPVVGYALDVGRDQLSFALLAGNVIGVMVGWFLFWLDRG